MSVLHQQADLSSQIAGPDPRGAGSDRIPGRQGPQGQRGAAVRDRHGQGGANARADGGGRGYHFDPVRRRQRLDPGVADQRDPPDPQESPLLEKARSQHPGPELCQPPRRGQLASAVDRPGSLGSRRGCTRSPRARAAGPADRDPHPGRRRLENAPPSVHDLGQPGRSSPNHFPADGGAAQPCTPRLAGGRPLDPQAPGQSWVYSEHPGEKRYRAGPAPLGPTVHLPGYERGRHRLHVAPQEPGGSPRHHPAGRAPVRLLG